MQVITDNITKYFNKYIMNENKFQEYKILKKIYL